MKKFIILSGPSCSGKTTLANQFLDKYTIIKEPATEIICRWKKENKPLPWISNTPEEWFLFENELYLFSLSEIQKIKNSNHSIFIFDRSIIDNLAFVDMLIGQKYVEKMQQNWVYPHILLDVKPQQIFSVILNRLPFESNDIRYEDGDVIKRQKIQYAILAKYYKMMPYKCIIEKKSQSILKRIQIVNKIIEGL